jgi:hypothetical protein
LGNLNFLDCNDDDDDDDDDDNNRDNNNNNNGNNNNNNNDDDDDDNGEFCVCLQDQVVNTKNYRKFVIKDGTIDDFCRPCKSAVENFQHIVSCFIRGAVLKSYLRWVGIGFYLGNHRV